MIHAYLLNDSHYDGWYWCLLIVVIMVEMILLAHVVVLQSEELEFWKGLIVIKRRMEISTWIWSIST